MVSFLYRMGAGIPGTVSRAEHSTIEPEYVDATSAATYPLGFGKPVIIGANGFLQSAAQPGVTAAQLLGFLVRSYPGGSSTDPLGVSTAPVSGLANRMRRGYMQALLNYGTASKDGPVYFRGTTYGGRPVGNLEAANEAVATAAAKTGGNTGNGTVSTGPTATILTPAGAYTVTFTSATVFTVSGPGGTLMPGGVVGTPYSYNGLAFTITAGGTAFVAGDGFVITVAQNTFAIPNCLFVGPADANGITEIAYNI